MSNFLEQFEYNAEGWNGVYNTNFQKLNSFLGEMYDAFEIPGTSTVITTPILTTELLTDNSSGTPVNTINAVSGSGADAEINNNFSSITEEIIHIKNDLENIRNKQLELLEKLRQSTGVGILDG